MDHSKTIRNMVVVFIISGLTAILGYAIRFYIANNYSVGEYGLVYSMISFFSFILIFVDFGLHQAIIKKVSELRAKKNEIAVKSVFITTFIFQITIALILSLLLYFLSKQINNYFFHVSNPLFFNIMILWFLTFPFNCLIIAYALSYQKTTWWALFEFSKLAFILLITIILTEMQIGISSVLIGYATVNIFLFCIFIIFNRNFIIPFKFKFNFASIYPETIKYGAFIIVGSLASTILTQTDTLMITYFKGVSDVGLYQAAVPLASLLFTAISPITIVLLSSVANLWAMDKKKEVVELLLLMQKYVLVFILPVTLTLSFFSGLAISIMFGSDYLSAKYCLMVLAFSFTFSSMSNVITYVLFGIGKAKNVMRFVIYGALSNIILCFILIYRFGIFGAAISTLFSNILIFILLTRLINQITKLRFPIVMWIKTAFASVFFIIPLYILKNILEMNYIFELFICLFVSGILYLTVCYSMKIISINEFNFLKNIVKKFKVL